MKVEGESQKEAISLHAPISGKVTNVKVAPNEEYRFLEELRMMTITGKNAEVHIKATP